MKKNQRTELVFILDNSGSMHGLEADTIGGFNSMIQEQKEQCGEAYVTTLLFNTHSKMINDRLPIQKVPEMTEREYRTYGSTALYDALGDAITHIAGIHKYARPEDVPQKTLFVITTDGMENASTRYGKGEVKNLIEKYKTQMGWEFLFLGANIDAVQEAAKIGIQKERAVTFVNDSIGTALNYKAVSRAVRDVRANQSIDDDWADSIRNRDLNR